MVCINTSWLKIGPTPDAGGLGQLPPGILIGRFSGPRESIACDGRQSLGQWGKDISACGEKELALTLVLSPRRGDHIRCLAVHRLPSTSRDQGLRATAGRPIQCERPNAIPSPGGEGQDEGELAAPKAVISLSRGGSPGQIESNPVQVEIFHRPDAETRRECARERMEMSGGAPPGDSNLGDFAAWRDESGIFSANWSESNLVQANAFFSRVLGAGRELLPRSGRIRDRRGCYLIDICEAVALKV
jgi:hypothetical protein